MAATQEAASSHHPSDHPGHARSVIVIGAGIVGMSCAFQLQQRGFQVTVVDPVPPGESCSYGNAGVISSGFCRPIVTPATLAQAPGWLLGRDSPVSVAPGYAPRLLPWLIQGARAGGRRRMESLSRALNALHATAREEHERQAAEAGCGELIGRREYLHVYASEASFRDDAAMWQARRRFGFRFRELSAREIPEVEPNLAPAFARAVLLEDQAIALDPGGLVKAVARAFAERQGRSLQQRVRTIEAGPDEALHVRTEDGLEHAGHVVIAAGAWSAELARPLGYRFPLAAERGYHLIYDDPGFALRQPVMFADRKFVANSMNMGLRLAGTAEFAPPERPATPARFEQLRRYGRRFFPKLEARRTPEASSWMGPRPSLPDTLPVIGAARKEPRVVFAFGHSHTGLTAGPMTGRIVADLVEGKPPPIDISAFSPERF